MNLSEQKEGQFLFIRKDDLLAFADKLIEAKSGVKEFEKPIPLKEILKTLNCSNTTLKGWSQHPTKGFPIHGLGNKKYVFQSEVNAALKGQGLDLP